MLFDSLAYSKTVLFLIEIFLVIAIVCISLNTQLDLRRSIIQLCNFYLYCIMLGLSSYRIIPGGSVPITGSHNTTFYSKPVSVDFYVYWINILDVDMPAISCNKIMARDKPSQFVPQVVLLLKSMCLAVGGYLAHLIISTFIPSKIFISFQNFHVLHDGLYARRNQPQRRSLPWATSGKVILEYLKIDIYTEHYI